MSDNEKKLAIIAVNNLWGAIPLEKRHDPMVNDAFNTAYCFINGTKIKTFRSPGPKPFELERPPKQVPGPEAA